MAFTYASLQELVLYHTYNDKLFYNTELIWENIANSHNVMDIATYFFLHLVPMQVLHWLYELFHTFFVITAQFTAFFAMVFWLFLFLYTFFVAEKHEDYFTEKRILKLSILEKILTLKERE
jgi:hypothetical protein